MIATYDEESLFKEWVNHTIKVLGRKVEERRTDGAQLASISFPPFPCQQDLDRASALVGML